MIVHSKLHFFEPQIFSFIYFFLYFIYLFIYFFFLHIQKELHCHNNLWYNNSLRNSILLYWFSEVLIYFSNRDAFLKIYHCCSMGLMCFIEREAQNFILSLWKFSHGEKHCSGPTEWNLMKSYFSVKFMWIFLRKNSTCCDWQVLFLISEIGTLWQRFRPKFCNNKSIMKV